MTLCNILSNERVLGNANLCIGKLVAVDEGENQEEDGSEIVVDRLKLAYRN